MRQTQMTQEDEIRAIHFKYEVPEIVVKELLDSGIRYTEADKMALLSCLTGKDIREIARLRKEQPWSRIQKELGLSAEVYEAKYLSHRANRLHRFYGIEESRALAALQEGYPNHWIRLAWLLEMKTGKKMEEILMMKKKTPKWKEWVQTNLNVDPEDFSRWILETRNPSLKPKT